jgi:signal transduction histidine kinase
MGLSREVAFAGFDALPTQLAILADDGTILYTNRAWRTFGEANDIDGNADTVGINYLGVCDASRGDDSTEAADGIRSVLRGDVGTFSFEYPCHTPTEKRWFSMRAKWFEYEDEDYVLVLHFDITDRKLAERRVEREAERLQNVAQILSHDLRNPLSVAIGYAEMLAADYDDDDRIEPIESSLERMETIIADALVMARNQRLDDSDKRLVELDAAAERAWSTVDTERATLVVDGTATFYAEPDYLRHVFENLFRNAVEHGGGDVTVEVGVVDGGFYVADDGPGVPPADRETVFESGYTTSDDGTGLGLGIVAQIVEAHGWRVSVGDADGGGARFEVTGVEFVE